jgi:poly(3-hydroxybutyrate) depolymerase
MQVVEEFSADPARVCLACLSAGVQRRIMAATVPDIFGAVGVQSGLAGRAAGTCGRPSLQWRGGTIRQRCEGPTAAIVFHGDADRAVNPVNSDHVIANARQEAPLTNW